MCRLAAARGTLSRHAARRVLAAIDEPVSGWVSTWKENMAALLLMAALSVASAQQRDDMTREAVDLAGGSVVFVSSTQDLPYFEVHGTDTFQCRFPTTTKGFLRRYWGVFATYLEGVAPDVASHPDSDWGEAWTKIGATAAVGFCNISLQTSEGRAYLTVVHNRACFGTAGCAYDISTMNVTATDIEALAAALRKHIP